MGNLDFSNNAGFSWYCILLLISGLTLVVLGPLRRRAGSQSTVSVVVGAVFLGYGLYLTFGFHGGHYFVSYWVLILPIVLITQLVRSSNATRYSSVARQAGPTLWIDSDTMYQ